MRTANFKLGHDKTSYLTQARLQQLGEFGQRNRAVKNDKRSISSGHGALRLDLAGKFKEKDADTYSVFSVGAQSMRSQPISQRDGDKMLIGPSFGNNNKQEAKKIAGTMKSLNWGYEHTRGGSNAPGLGETSNQKIGIDNNKLIRDQQSTNKIRE